MPARFGFAICSLAALPILSATAQNSRNVDGQGALYCLDSTHTYQPFSHANYTSLAQAYRRHFDWQPGLYTTSENQGRIVFSQTGRPQGEMITYDVSAYNGGIALERMHVRLQGVNQNLEGNDMCYQTMTTILK